MVYRLLSGYWAAGPARRPAAMELGPVVLALIAGNHPTLAGRDPIDLGYTAYQGVWIHI